MPRFITMARYTNAGTGGLIEGDTDRKAVMEAMHQSVGATLVDYSLTRGQYDFYVISEADSFDQVAAMTLKAKATGPVENPVILEAIDVNQIRQTVSKVEFTPPHK